MEATPEVKQRPLGALSAWHRDFARAFAAAVPMEQPARDPDAFRWLAVSGVPADPSTYTRAVILAECQEEAEEKADLLHRLALSLRVPFKLRPLICKDPEAAPAWGGEHDLREVDPLRDPDAIKPHFVCRRCSLQAETMAEIRELCA